ncbi:glutathione S-transferase C-terminal-like protein [Saccharata proteae CBS 121410]|uniref:Glutathione S-transferase C-terminal-like protein n=1 Tax=Saccharata proteae CBS 121410 TaxID=1314787 RepID=A0A6A5YF11_9PEZI|nr:glutathione S-transferase C-terminal-like protein [Saccharata proteae CBS 121410]
MAPPITLYFLQASRSIRTAWLLEELNLDYDVKFWERENGKAAPQAAKDAAASPLGKFPSIRDGDVAVHESGAITQYLCETYDKSHRLLPTDPVSRVPCLQYIHAAEATFLLHGLAVIYVRWNYPTTSPPAGLAHMEGGMAKNVRNDFDWLEAELRKADGKFLCGNEVTAADCMMHFSIDLIMKRRLGIEGGKWPNVEQWLKDCEGTEAYKRAVENTGHKM